MKFGLVGAAVAACVVALAVPAAATVYTVTYEGQLQSGLDQHNSLGFAQSDIAVDLAGRAIKVVFTIDDSVAGATSDLASNNSFYYGENAANPVTAQLFLADQVFGIGAAFGPSGANTGSSTGSVAASQQGADSYSHLASTNFNPLGYQYLVYAGGAASAPFPWLSPIPFLSSADWRDLTTAEANAANNRYIGFTLIAFNADGTDTPMNIYGEANGVAVTVATAAVPEPATWALMILGFGMAGASLRARPRNGAQTAA